MWTGVVATWFIDKLGTSWPVSVAVIVSSVFVVAVVGLMSSCAFVMMSDVSFGYVCATDWYGETVATEAVVGCVVDSLDVAFPADGHWSVSFGSFVVDLSMYLFGLESVSVDFE